MELVGQAVEHGHAGVFRQFFDHVLPEAAIFDAVVHPAQHAGSVFDAFLMPDLAGGRLQISHPRPLVARGDFKRAAGAGRCFFKNQGDVLPFHPLHFTPRLFGGFQLGGKVEVGGDFFGRKVQKVSGNGGFSGSYSYFSFPAGRALMSNLPLLYFIVD